jgi:hypothetical protein
MWRFFALRHGFWILLLPLTLSACTKGGSGTSSSNSAKSTTNSDELTLKTFKTGPGTNLNPEIYSGTYYTRFSQFRITGFCGGTVKQVSVAIQSPSANSTETINCLNSSFTWDKTFTDEADHQVIFTPLSQAGQAISGMSSITKNIVYDITVPDQPTFLLPTTGNQYLITDSTSQIQIKGRVKRDVKKLTGPNLQNLVLRTDEDGIHSSFLFNATVTNNSVMNLNFTAYDGAGNSTSNTMTIESRTDVVVPLAIQEIGSSTVTSGSIVIQSSASYLSGSHTHSNIKHVVGGAATIGEW